MVKNTTILIRNYTRERLKQRGKMGQTYDELIDELLKSKIMGEDPPEKR
jgi:hypothetical protein